MSHSIILLLALFTPDDGQDWGCECERVGMLSVACILFEDVYVASLIQGIVEKQIGS